ncbi:MAG: hypothetical protein IKE90_00345 [Bacilli bacterium]|nr:hypothetical protein [Bacilli bacterium]
MKKFRFLVLFALLFSFSFSAQAKSINRFYAEADETISLKDDVDGSSFLAGGSIDSSSNINGANFIAGNNIDFSGSSEYAIIAGNSIDVSGNVLRDTVIAGNIINIRNEANLERDAIIVGSDIQIMGNISRNVTIFSRKVSLKGAKIHGNVRVQAEEIDVDSDTVIDGKFSYPKDARANISSHITNIEKTSPIQTNDDDLISFLMSRVWSFMSIVFIFALLTIIRPKVFEDVQNNFSELDFNKGVSTFTKGLSFLIIVPVISLMLLMLPFGIPLSLIILALYFITIYISTLFSGYLFGYKLWQKFLNSDINLLLVGMLGYSLLFLLELIPVVGSLIKLLFTLFGIGIIIKLFMEKES